jgi:hypothetical protein
MNTPEAEDMTARLNNRLVHQLQAYHTKEELATIIRIHGY